jgi:ATP-dependent RNA helicase DDX19/DBP5
MGMLYRMDTTLNTTQAMCVTPTRELAIQIVEKAIRPMSLNMVPELVLQLAVSQADPPSRTPHLVVGTPGKLVDWLKRRILSSKHLKVFVLDEADTMVEAGSGHRANSLLLQKQLPPHCQCLFFSATFSSPVVQFASKMIANADKILVEDGPEYLVRVRNENFRSVGMVAHLFVRLLLLQ